MSDKLRNISYYDSTGAAEYSFNNPYSEETARLIDQEEKNLIDEQYQRALSILAEYKEGHSQLAQMLFDKEVIFADNLEQIFGKRKWQSRADELIAENDEAKKKAADEDAAKAVLASVVADVAENAEKKEEGDADKSANDEIANNGGDNVADNSASTAREDEKED